MAGIFGHLNISDSDRVFNSTAGQQAIYEAATNYVNQINNDLEQAMSVFIERSTSDYKLRYKLPGGGRLQRRGSDGRFGATKASGQWDVALPLEDFGAQIAGNDVDMAYMTVAELERHINTVVSQNVNTVRFEILKALFNDTQRTFIDPLVGSLDVEPLANGDAVVYPPVLGSESEATDDHYLESGYTVANMSDTNNPFVTIRNEIEEHFGTETGNSNIAVFIGNDSRAKSEALTDFTEVEDRFVRPGQDQAIPTGLPAGLPGTVLGRCSGVWVVEWRWMPATYMLGVHLDQPKPLIRRIDPADTGLGDGLQLVARDMEFPFEASFWRHRFGLGAGNRLNGVVMEVAAGGSYSIPTAYQ